MPIRASQADQNRDARSRELFERIAPPAEYWIDAELQLMDVSLGQSISISHFGGPWGEGVNERRHHRLMGTSENVGTRTIKAYVRDERERHYNGVWEKFSFDVPNDFGDGLFAFGPRASRHFYRGAAAFSVDPRDGRVRKVDRTTASRESRMTAERIGTGYRGALQMKSAIKNLVGRSSMVSGLTGITAVLPGAAPSTLSVDSALPQLFDFSDAIGGPFTTQKLVITAAAAAPTGGGASWPATDSTVQQRVYRVAIDYSCDSGADLYWRLRQTVGGVPGNFWNDSTGGFQAGTVDNALPTSTSITRFTSKLIAMGSQPTGSVETLEIIQQTGGTVSRKNYVYHVQITPEGWLSGYIPRDTGATTDPAPSGRCGTDYLAYNNDASGTKKRIVNANRFTLYLRFIANFATEDFSVTSLFLTRTVGIFRLEYRTSSDATPGTFILRHDGVPLGGAKWTLAAVADGAVGTIISLEAVNNVTRGQEVAIAIRSASLTSDAGELDDLYGTAGADRNFDMSVSVDGGVPVTVSGTYPGMNEEDLSRLWIGPIEGSLLEWASLPYVLTDDEVDALLRQPATEWTA